MRGTSWFLFLPSFPGLLTAIWGLSVYLLPCDSLIPNKIREDDLFHPQPSYIWTPSYGTLRFLNCFWPCDITLLQSFLEWIEETGAEGKSKIITFMLEIKVYWLSLERQYQKSWLLKLPTYLMIWPPTPSTCQNISWKNILKSERESLFFYAQQYQINSFLKAASFHHLFLTLQYIWLLSHFYHPSPIPSCQSLRKQILVLEDTVIISKSSL